jgi:hypothetical protein
MIMNGKQTKIRKHEVKALSRHLLEESETGVAVKLHTFLTSALRSGHFNPAQKHRYVLTGGFVGPTGGMDVVTKRESPYLCQESNPDHPAYCYSHFSV